MGGLQGSHWFLVDTLTRKFAIKSVSDKLVSGILTSKFGVYRISTSPLYDELKIMHLGN